MSAPSLTISLSKLTELGVTERLQMKLKKVICSICKNVDEAWWSDFGAEQPCLNCAAAPVELVLA
jgi:hypothetical protein